MKWKEAQILSFIAEYKKTECLWNHNDPNFKNREMRNDAFEYLASIFGSPTEEIKKRIKNFRGTYLQEKNKVEKSKRAGKIYRPVLIWYHEMDALLDHSFNRNQNMKQVEQVLSIPEQSFNIPDQSLNLPEQDTEYIEIKEEHVLDDTYNQFETITCTSETSNQDSNQVHASSPIFAISPNRKRKKNNDDELPAIVSTNDHLNNIPNDCLSKYEQEHEFDIFGRSVSKQLKSFSSLAAALRVQSKIQNILTEERIKDLSSMDETCYQVLQDGDFK